MRAPRAAALLLAAGCVAGLHAAAGWGLALALHGTHDVASAARPARLQWVALPPLASATDRQPLPAPDAPLEATPSAGTPAPALQDPAPDSAATERFLRTREVDEPARPQHDWALDADALAALNVQRVVFHAWIDADGRWADVQVTEIDPPEQRKLAPLIEWRLRQTPMLAALRKGRTVAHQQRIELELAPPVPEPG